jgi:hypothetical protein
MDVTFWDFFEIVVVHVRRHVHLSGEWPYGVFGRDATEGLIQYGTAHAAVYAEDGCAHIIVRLPESAAHVFRAEISPEAAAHFGDEVGKLLLGSGKSNGILG